MNMVIRVDASSVTGIGHLVRCRTLAQALRREGAVVRFVCRHHSGHAIDELRADGFSVSALPPLTGDLTSLDTVTEEYARWLGVTQRRDAVETTAALDVHPDWLVVDHYGLDVEWEKALRPHVSRIFVIDDLADRDHDCDALLDQNYVKDAEARYLQRLPGHATRFLGPKYALLRPEYGRYHQDLVPPDGQIRRVLLYFGGTDPQNLTGRALEALTINNLQHLEVDVVVGANNPHRQTLIDQAAERRVTRTLGPRPHLADLMAAADLAVGAGGTTTWERCCLGLPSVVVSAADNQRPACEALAEDGLIVYAGNWNVVTVDDLRAAIEKLIHDPDRLRKMSAAAYCAVDGSGTERVVRYLLGTN